MDHAPRTDGTRLVDRARPFQPSLHDVNDMIRQLGERQIEGPTLALALLDAAGVQLRLWTGAGPQVLSVGRHAACDLRLAHADASLRHAIVIADDDGVRVIDLSSLCGLSGRPAAPAGRWAVVRAGDGVVAAAVVTAADPTGDVDELRRLCRLPTTPALARVLHGLHPSRSATTLVSPLPSSSSPPSTLPGPGPRPRRAGAYPVVRLDDVTGPRADAGPVQTEPLLLGRSTRCHLQVDDIYVSRLHAALVPVRCGAQRQAMVVDVGSTNGTTLLSVVDGAVHERPLGPAGRGHIVRAGDMVDLGERVRIRIVGDVGGEH
jgi:pSer/pThr/pTyr-binding forkhead associated (FHA) protein